MTARKLKVLLVEDEALVSMFVQDMLEELGHEVAVLADRLEHARNAAREAEVDLAIVDLNLHGERVTGVTDVLTARGVPFVVATGYGARGEGYEATPHLTKPFALHDLEKSIAVAIGARAR